MIKITHNNKCSKSRNSLKILQESGVDFETVDYINGNLSEIDLKEILEKLNMTAEEITRKGENLFKEKLKEETLSWKRDFSKGKISRKKLEKNWLEMLLKNTSLIERPLIWDDKKAVIGRPPENVKIFF